MSGVDIAVVNVSIVDGVQGRRTACARDVGSRAEVLSVGWIDAHDGRRRAGHVLIGVSQHVYF